MQADADGTLSSAWLSLSRAGTLDVEEGEVALRVSRRRRLPERGFFRLVIPRVSASVTSRQGAPVVRVRPDVVAWIVLVVLAGGVVVELTMDRVRYPRSYPPAFVYLSAALYTLFLALEAWRTRRAVHDALKR